MQHLFVITKKFLVSVKVWKKSVFLFTNRKNILVITLIRGLSPIFLLICNLNLEVNLEIAKSDKYISNKSNYIIFAFEF